ncbi:MAG: tetratricopeptide/SEL1-like repeat protein [Gammaproteobacteria bacterium]|nr:tetratricopeptide/SEL1-like repeat protein [Gammaproteobacteria bacterium]
MSEERRNGSQPRDGMSTGEYGAIQAGVTILSKTIDYFENRRREAESKELRQLAWMRERFNQLAEVANTSMQRGDFNQALQALKEALEIWPATLSDEEDGGFIRQRNYAKLVHNFALCKHKLGKHKKAIDFIREKLDSDDADIDVDTRNLLGYCHEEIGEIDAAISSYRQSLSPRTGNQNQYGIRARMLFLLRNYVEVVEHVSNAIVFERPDWFLLKIQAISYLELNRYGKAANAFTTSLELFSGDATLANKRYLKKELLMMLSKALSAIGNPATFPLEIMRPSWNYLHRVQRIRAVPRNIDLRQMILYCQELILVIDPFDITALTKIEEMVGDAVDKEILAKIGKCYADGIRIERNHGSAITYYDRAIEQGSNDARVWRAALYLDGYDVFQDRERDEVYAEIRESLNIAHENGHTLATFYLGIMLLNGYGIERNPEEAKGHITRAAEAGCDRANLFLALSSYFGYGEPFEWSFENFFTYSRTAINVLVGDVLDESNEGLYRKDASVVSLALLCLFLINDAYVAGLMGREINTFEELILRSGLQGRGESRVIPEFNRLEAPSIVAFLRDQPLNTLEQRIKRAIGDGDHPLIELTFALKLPLIKKDYGQMYERLLRAHNLAPLNQYVNFFLAICHYNGYGTEENLEEAARLFQLSYDYGFQPARVYLAKLTYFGPDRDRYERAMQYLGYEPDREYTEPLYDLPMCQQEETYLYRGLMCALGEGTTKNLLEAARTFRWRCASSLSKFASNDNKAAYSFVHSRLPAASRLEPSKSREINFFGDIEKDDTYRPRRSVSLAANGNYLVQVYKKNDGSIHYRMGTVQAGRGVTGIDWRDEFEDIWPSDAETVKTVMSDDAIITIKQRATDGNMFLRVGVINPETGSVTWKRPEVSIGKGIIGSINVCADNKCVFTYEAIKTEGGKIVGTGQLYYCMVDLDYSGDALQVNVVKREKYTSGKETTAVVIPGARGNAKYLLECHKHELSTIRTLYYSVGTIKVNGVDFSGFTEFKHRAITPSLTIAQNRWIVLAYQSKGYSYNFITYMVGKFSEQDKKVVWRNGSRQVVGMGYTPNITFFQGKIHGLREFDGQVCINRECEINDRMRDQRREHVPQLRLL